MKGLGLGSKVGVLLPFSRVHESEADLIGLELMARSGFDPRQSIDFWKHMAKVNQRQPLEFLSTHPSHETRIEKLKEIMDSGIDYRKEQLEKLNSFGQLSDFLAFDIDANTYRYQDMTNNLLLIVSLGFLLLLVGPLAAWAAT